MGQSASWKINVLHAQCRPSSNSSGASEGNGNKKPGRRKKKQTGRGVWELEGNQEPPMQNQGLLQQEMGNLLFSYIIKRWISRHLNNKSNAHKMKEWAALDQDGAHLTTDAQMIFKTLHDPKSQKTLIKTVNMTFIESKWKWTPTQCKDCFKLWFTNFTGRCHILLPQLFFYF